MGRSARGGQHFRAVGVLTLNECAAIYTGGKFGEIPELYVELNLRSAGIGPMLLEAAESVRDRTAPLRVPLVDR